MAKRDLTGQKFNMLTVTGIHERRGKGFSPFWKCLCDCGKEHIANADNIVFGKVKSCGCLRLEKNKTNRLIHGQARTEAWGYGKQTKEYRAWCAAKGRCFNPRNQNYKHWGARGITMCEEWKNDFLAFFSHMGKCPAGLTLDRINNDGNYEPGNCRWATRSEQNKNRRKFTKKKRLLAQLEEIDSQ